MLSCACNACELTKSIGVTAFMSWALWIFISVPTCKAIRLVASRIRTLMLTEPSNESSFKWGCINSS